MKNKNEIRKNIKNAEGKRILEKTLLNYSIEIIEELKINPKLLNNLLDELEITENKFINYISGEEEGNITFYDQTLKLIKKKNYKND